MEIAQGTFISSTYWTDRIGPAAALATIKKIRENNIPKYLIEIGRKIQEGWKASALKHKIEIDISGIEPLGHFSFKYKNSLVLKTLFTQSMLEKGFLATTSFYASYGHREGHIKKYLEAVDDVFDFISNSIKEGKPERYLKGPVCHSGFKRLA